MDKTDLAIATITLARKPEEQSLLLSGLRSLAALSVPVFVTDGGSAQAFLDLARQVDGLAWCETARGLWPQTRRSLEAARSSGARWILYTEPDKADFFGENLATFIRNTTPEERTGIVLAARDAARNATFPAFQQYTESIINRCCAEVIGGRFDYSYGPFLLASSLVPRLIPPKEDIGWGWRPFAFGVAHRLGSSIEQVFAASACPAGQRDDAERIYRMQQLAESVEGLVLSTKVSL